MFYEIPVEGDGNCMFTAIRLGMEINYLVTKMQCGDIPQQIIVNGKNNAMIRAGLRLRLKVVEWFREHLEKEMEGMGKYIENEDRNWKRKDLIALELVKRGKDLEKDSILEINRYLLDMSMPGKWGSTPEYTAASYLSKSQIQIWQKGNGEPILINTVNNESAKIYLRFHKNHYTALITVENYEILKKYIGDEKLRHMIAFK